jgi:16S rRNA pseudouridine516 synthase
MSLRRLDQLLSSLGYCTRREVSILLRDERVLLDGKPIRDASLKVNAINITVDNEPLDFPDGLLVMLHKPVGVVCTHDSSEGKRIYDFLPPRWLIRNPPVTSIGRLDKETSGLILVTDNGKLVQQMTSPKKHVEKTYVATLDREISADDIEAFKKGILLSGDDGISAPAILKPKNSQMAEVTIHEGKYHQVRRMFAARGIHVHQLHRESFGPFSLGDLDVGEWKALPFSLVLS